MPNAEAAAIDFEMLSLATDAYIWAFPRMLYEKYLRDFKSVPAPFNRFFAMNSMATPNHGGVNVDILYGVAWLDLGPEPTVLHVPDAKGRYYSIQMMDVYANNFAYVGRRTTGTARQQFCVAGPDWEGTPPAGMPLIRASSRRVFCFLRTLVDDESDVAAVNEFDGDIALAPLSAYPTGLLTTALLDDLGPYFPHSHSHLDELGARFFDQLGDALAADPPTHPQDVEMLQRFAAVGVGPGLHPAQTNSVHAALLAEAVTRGHRTIFATTASTAIDGWSCNRNFDDEKQDPLLKAAINRRGLGMVGIEEAIYLMPASQTLGRGDAVHTWNSCGPDGKPLSGSKRYRLYFPAGRLPPVDAFWSLTMYDHDLMLVTNPIGRHSIGSRTPGLRYGADGSLELSIQRERPESGAANWLPAPDGEFQIMFRGYQPRREFQRGEYQVPPLQIV